MLWKNKLRILIIPAIFSLPAQARAVVEFPNPIQANDLPSLVQSISTALITIVIPVSTIGIIWAGFKFVTASASGNDGELTKARKMLLWIILGTALVIGSSLLARAVVNFAKFL